MHRYRMRSIRSAKFRRWLFGTAIAVAAGTVFAMDAPPLILEHLTTSDGLPQGTVMTTLQDSQGFIWLGTEDGLVRYDGHEMVRYAYSRASRSGLPGNFIYQVIEDANHDIWIAIKDSGVARWNRSTDTFNVYRHDPINVHSISSDSVRALALGPGGQIWVGSSDSGIDVVDPNSGPVRHFRHDPEDAGSLTDDRIFTLTSDHNGGVWVGTENGLDRWDADRSGFEHFHHDASDAHSLSGNQISRVLEDSAGNLWVGTFDGGLDRMDRRGNVSEVFRHDSAESASLASDDIRAILEDHAGHLWIGTAEGLDLLDREAKQLIHYRHDPSEAESLRDSYVMSLYEDESGLMWIGTRSGGVSRWNPRSWELGGHRPDWLGGKLVTAFADGGHNRVWISSLGGGLVLFDTESGTASDFDAILGKQDAIGDKRVMALRRDREGNLWIGTMTHGLLELTSRGELIKIPVKAGDEHGLSAPGVMSIFQSRSGDIWIGTHGGGANVLDPRTRLIRQLPYDALQSGAISFANVSAFAQDSHGNMWIGTDGGGLDLARPDGSVVRAFRHDASDRRSLPANTVYSLEVDAKDRVWIGTDGGGLARVVGDASEPSSIQFEVLSREEGLASDTVYGVLADSAGQIWLSGNAGLLRFNPDTRAIKTYHRQHGLQGEEFDSGAYHRLADGRLCFGGPGGFNIIDSSRITEHNKPPRLSLTGLTVMGLPVTTPKPSWLLERLDLDFRANIVTLDFGVLDFTSPKRNRIAYRMAGLTDHWIDVGTQQRITLTNLDAGDHLLEIRAANADSVWSVRPLSLKIHRDPAPWRSGWAYAAYIATVLLLVVHRLRLQRAKFRRVVRQQQRLETEVATRTRELSESNHQLAEAVQAKGRFMDRMSHELRTPMNGVLGMTELLSRTELSPTQARITQTIRSSGRVLLQIVDDLLDLSKINAGKVTLEDLPIDLLSILEDCASLFAGSVEAKNVELIVCPPPEDHNNLIGDPLRLRQILMNLIGNAVKFTAHGEIVIRADIKRRSDAGATLHLSVSDTGIGMDAVTLGKIFTPFTQADESTTRRFGGTGLGLAICRELAHLMGGTITAESAPEVGSVFRVEVPLKMRGNSVADEAPFARRSVHIVCDHPALRESASRHLTALGFEIMPAEEGPEIDGTRADICLVDAKCLETRVFNTLEPPPRLIVMATEAQTRSASFELLLPGKAAVLKPIRRHALQEAIGSALGMDLQSGPPVNTPIPPVTMIQGHMLLVEDEAVNAAVAQGYLTALGCTSVWVESGADAIARCAHEDFDLILMDLSMPKMDGVATCARIRQLETGRRRTPIIALTAHSSEDYRQTVLQAGMDDILTKPCTLEDCETVLRKWVKPRLEAAAPMRASTIWTEVDPLAVMRLKKLRGGTQPDLYCRLVELFQSSAARLLEELRSSLHGNDFQQAAALCHKFASSAANVGATSFARGIRELEERCKAADGAGCHELYANLRAAYPLLVDELRCQQKLVNA